MRESHVRKLRKDFADRNIVSLRDSAADLARDSLLFDDYALLDLSLLSYSLSKFLEKPYILENKAWKKFSDNVLGDLDKCTALLSKGKEDDADKLVHHLIKSAESLSASLGRFVSSTIDKARLKAAAQMYAHGASLGTAAERCGVDKRILGGYVGSTHIPDKYETLSVKERLENAKKIFGGN
ncbi:MAG: hypothetical protein V1881_03600 [Candidatus Micrarchaeota archaeon]